MINQEERYKNEMINEGYTSGKVPNVKQISEKSMADQMRHDIDYCDVKIEGDFITEIEFHENVAFFIAHMCVCVTKPQSKWIMTTLHKQKLCQLSEQEENIEEVGVEEKEYL